MFFNLRILCECVTRVTASSLSVVSKAVFHMLSRWPVDYSTHQSHQTRAPRSDATIVNSRFDGKCVGQRFPFQLLSLSRGTSEHVSSLPHAAEKSPERQPIITHKSMDKRFRLTSSGATSEEFKILVVQSTFPIYPIRVFCKRVGRAVLKSSICARTIPQPLRPPRQASPPHL